MDIGLVARRTEAVHVDVDEPAQFSDEELDVDAGAPVHLGRIFAGQDGDTHPLTLAAP